MMDDSIIIERCLKGEKEAFRFLVERYQAQAVGHSLAILANREDARDATQEAFVDAFQSLKKFDRSRRFYPWFYVLLRHRCYKLIAKKREAENIEDAEIIAPQGKVLIEKQNLHTWLWPKIAQAKADGQFEILVESKEWVKPVPYAAYPGQVCDEKGLVQN